MEPLELDAALEELEIRLERLRSLYEQYFLGIEKIEPSVARKDVDRRIYALRREKIRNTAKRFKFQTIIQRYNTFQQYWQRICREIENGTYKRHMLRAERILSAREPLTIAARRRGGEFARSSSKPPPQESAEPAAAEAPAATPERPEPLQPAAARDSRPGPARPAPRSEKPARYESLDLDMDFLGDWDPAKVPPKRPAPKAQAPEPSRPKPAVPAEPGAPAKRPTAATPRAEAPLSEARLRELHARLLEAKRQTQDKGKVSLEGLAKSLRAAEARLRERHKNRHIDFDIVIKDGKAVVKPIVR